jgi:hypothetical protein
MNIKTLLPELRQPAGNKRPGFRMGDEPEDRDRPR